MSDFSEIPPTLTTSEEGLKRLNIVAKAGNLEPLSASLKFKNIIHMITVIYNRPAFAKASADDAGRWSINSGGIWPGSPVLAINGS